jgi:hypothetical protein
LIVLYGVFFIVSNAAAGSIYFIGNLGAVLGFTDSSKSSAELKGMIDMAWQKYLSPPVALQPSPVAGTGASSSRTSSAVAAAPGGTQQQASTGRPAEVSNTAQALANANEAVRVAEEAVGQDNLTLEQKIERAQQLATAKRQQKFAKEAEVIEERRLVGVVNEKQIIEVSLSLNNCLVLQEERQREKERREMGKGMAELKRWQEEEEGKRLVEQRKKEKREEQELRQRVKDQIAQDRVARNARTNVSFLTEGSVSHNDQPSSTTSPSVRPQGVGASAATARDYSGQARLQFRMPTGSSISHGFDPDSTTLSNVRDFLITNNHVTFRY